MLTQGEQIQQIMREERGATLAQVDALGVAAQTRNDLLALWVRLQATINSYVGEQDRTLHSRVVPTTLRLAADELDRVSVRLQAAGLAPRVTHDES